MRTSSEVHCAVLADVGACTLLLVWEIRPMYYMKQSWPCLENRPTDDHNNWRRLFVEIDLAKLGQCNASDGIVFCFIFGSLCIVSSWDQFLQQAGNICQEMHSFDHVPIILPKLDCHHVRHAKYKLQQF